MFFRGDIIGKYKNPLDDGRRGGFGTVYLADDTWNRQEGRLKVPHKQGVEFGELLRERACSRPSTTEHRRHPDGGEAGERLLHRHGVHARQDDGTVMRWTVQLSTPSTTPTDRHCSTAISGPPRDGRRERPAQGGRLRHLAVSRNRRTWHHGHRQPRLWRRSSFSARRCLRPITMYQMLTGGTLRHALTGRPRWADTRRAPVGRLV